jgi:serine/threonine protein kinase
MNIPTILFSHQGIQFEDGINVSGTNALKDRIYAFEGYSGTVHHLSGPNIHPLTQIFHHIGFVHCDLKPSNFCVGSGSGANVIYMIDFGLSKRFQDQYTREHVHQQRDKTKKLTGTPRYASINNHLGFELSRRDDIESLSYILAYFGLGRLPWQGIKAGSRETKCNLITRKKQETDMCALCAAFPLASEMNKHAQTLAFAAVPDFMYLRTILKQSFVSSNIFNDSMFDWLNGSIRLLHSQKVVEEHCVLNDKNLVASPTNCLAPVFWCARKFNGNPGLREKEKPVITLTCAR